VPRVSQAHYEEATDTHAALRESFKYKTLIVSLINVDRSIGLPGYDADISLLVEVTREAVQEKLKGDASVVWTIAERAMSNVQVPQPEHGAK
jgi:hypothetical protein